MMTSRIGEVTRKGNALRGGRGLARALLPPPLLPALPRRACAARALRMRRRCRVAAPQLPRRAFIPIPTPAPPSKTTFSFAPTASLRFIFGGRREFCALVFRLNARRRLLGSFARGDEACHHPQCFCVGGRARKVARHGL